MKKRMFLAMAAVFGLACGVQASAEDIIVLFTNDVHCGIENGFGYAGVAAYKDYVETLTPYVTLVDCGDAIQGEFIGLTSNGSYIVDIMNEMEYDLAVLGNHEFDYGMEAIRDRMEQANAAYLGCNITYTGSKENLLAGLKPYEIVEYGDVSVAYIGVTTPFSTSSSTPTFFMEDGEYVYHFASGNEGQDLYDCVQGYVDECREKGADYVIVLAHLGDNEEYTPFSSVELAQNTIGIDAILDGHAHSVLPCWIETNPEGKEVLISSTGTKLANIGQLVISEDGTITTGLISHYPKTDDRIQDYIDVIQATYEADLQQVVGTSDVTLTGYTKDGIRLVRSRETTIGNFCADAYRAVADADIAIVNGGGIRADIPEGEITYENLFSVHPYGNSLCKVEATGQEILDCLEMCSRKTLAVIEEDGNPAGEEGGFQNVSGLKYTIDTSIESSVMVDENESFISVDGERRVKDVSVLNENGEYEPIDPEKVYTLAAHNYIIKEGGDGCTIFQDNVMLMDGIMTDYQVLLTYLDMLGGNIGMEYAEVEGRITVK